MMKKLVETTNSRIYSHITEDDNWAIVSPYRSENDESTNEKLMSKFKSEVRNSGYGFIQFVSRWVEDGEAFDESSLLIPNCTEEDALKFGKEYHQSSVIVKDDNGCNEICTTNFVDGNHEYNYGDVVRTFNLSGNKTMNYEEAEAIFSKRKGGPASMPKNKTGRKNLKPFRLSEVYEVSQPRPSYFQNSVNKKLIFKKGNCINESLNEATKDVSIDKMSKKDKKAFYDKQRNTWGRNPMTRTKPSDKIYDRKKFKKDDLNESGDRETYLRGLADEYGVDYGTVKQLADVLGPEEDYDALVTELEDMLDYRLSHDDSYRRKIGYTPEFSDGSEGWVYDLKDLKQVMSKNSNLMMDDMGRFRSADEVTKIYKVTVDEQNDEAVSVLKTYTVDDFMNESLHEADEANKDENKNSNKCPNCGRNLITDSTGKHCPVCDKKNNSSEFNTSSISKGAVSEEFEADNTFDKADFEPHNKDEYEFEHDDDIKGIEEIKL